MIPKIIHFIWVGDEPKSKIIEDCIKTWHQKLPDYEIKEWNESNFDMNENHYIQQAYQAKKWAFVSDYIRCKVLYEMGGVYLDTDVRVLDKLDDLLNDKGFIGFENEQYLSAAIIGAEKHSPFMQEMIDYYQDLDFTFDEKNPYQGVNTFSVTEHLERYGLVKNNQEQTLENGFHIYPDGVLCNPSKDSKTIHLFTGTWLNGLNLKKRIVLALKQHISTPHGASLYQKIIRR
ncbi:MAG: glycosyltransferase [Lactobacillus sp.]|nr:glycosyltransferase [Lactobacillus sp.]